MMRDLRTYALIASQATLYVALDLGEAIVSGFKRGWALGMARHSRLHS